MENKSQAFILSCHKSFTNKENSQLNFTIEESKELAWENTIWHDTKQIGGFYNSV